MSQKITSFFKSKAGQYFALPIPHGKPCGIGRAKIQFRMVGEFHEFDTWKILHEFLVLQIHLNSKADLVVPQGSDHVLKFRPIRTNL
jgi:hypothetical protein